MVGSVLPIFKPPQKLAHSLICPLRNCCIRPQGPYIPTCKDLTVGIINIEPSLADLTDISSSNIDQFRVGMVQWTVEFDFLRTTMIGVAIRLPVFDVQIDQTFRNIGP